MREWTQLTLPDDMLSMGECRIRVVGPEDPWVIEGPHDEIEVIQWRVAYAPEDPWWEE